MKKQLEKNWKFMGLSGLISLTIGIIAIVTPESSIHTFIRILGGITLAGALFFILVDLLNRKHQKPWGVWLVQGIVLLIPAILFLASPTLVIRLIFNILGIWAILAGAFHIYMVVSLRHLFNNYMLSVLNGIFIIIIGILLMTKSVEMANTITLFIGLFFSVYGAWQIYNAYQIYQRLRHWETENEETLP